MSTQSDRETTFEVGETCWRVEKARRLGLIVDAADYFRALRQSMISATRQIMMIGWDFDFEIDMLPGEADDDGMAPDGLPNALGPFIEALVERNAGLDIYLLKWNGAVLMAPGRVIPSAAMAAFSDDRIHFALDGHHPFGACHHQKIVVLDDRVAFCGGIDATQERWDTRDHTPDDPLRTGLGGELMPPWHDVTAVLDAPAAEALGELSRQRWLRATDDRIDAPRNDAGGADWPDYADVAVRDVNVAIMRTEPPYDGVEIVDEIEQHYLAAIRSARDVIYAESQYLSAEAIIDALEERLREPDGPEVVIVNPQAARAALEDQAMHTLRARALYRLMAAAPAGRFRAFYPVNAAEEPIYVHAKVMIVDDGVLRVGSSNIDDRSMGFDTECDIAFEGTHENAREAIRAFRLSLLAEHLDTDPDTVAEAWEREGSLVAAIDTLNSSEGRGLRVIEPKEETWTGKLLADTRMFDRRYERGENTRTGEGIRPRHLAAAAGVGVVLVAGWLAWRYGTHRKSDRAV